MSGHSCLDYLTQYSYNLSANPENNPPWPVPLFFRKTGCQGVPISIDTTVTTPQDITDDGKNLEFGSFWIPPHWKVVLESKDAITLQDGVSMTTNNATFVLYPGTANQLKNNVKTVTVRQPVDATGTAITVQQWKLDRCMGRKQDIVGAEPLASYLPGSEECDAFMNSYCLRNIDDSSNKQARADCACLIDEKTLRDTYCEPGNTSDLCANRETLPSALPVTCFGKNCSNGGYRWRRMMNQKCSITLCEQVITLLGDDIVIKGGSKLYCGNREIDVQTVTPTEAAAAAKPPTSIPQWLWLVVAMSIFLVVIVIPIAVIILRRYYDSLEEVRLT